MVNNNIRGDIMKMSKTMMAMMGGLGIFGYMYLKKHPDKMNKMREIMMEANRMMYNKLDNTNM